MYVQGDGRALFRVYCIAFRHEKRIRLVETVHFFAVSPIILPVDVQTERLARASKWSQHHPKFQRGQEIVKSALRMILESETEIREFQSCKLSVNFTSLSVNFHQKINVCTINSICISLITIDTITSIGISLITID